MKKIFACFSILIFLFGMQVWADINLDGDFSDWVDKPSIETEKESPAQEASPNTAVPSVEPKNSLQQNAPAENERQQPDVTVQPAQDVPEQQAQTTEQPSPSAELDDQQAEQPSSSGESTDVPSPSTEAEQESSQPVNAANTINEESISQDKSNNGVKFKINQLQWHLSDEQNVLYIMARLSHPIDMATGSFTTHFITDFGEYDAITTYDTGDGSVLSSLNGTSIGDVTGSCNVINNNTIEVEYGIPLPLLIQDIKMGYLIKFQVLTVDDQEPKNSYVTISTASTAPYLGVGICVALGVGIPYFIKRKKAR